jgi:pentatricopeptide repeat protein
MFVILRQFYSDIFLNARYSLALACLANCKDNLTEAATKAEEILNNMRESYQNGNSSLRPNSYCYNVVIDAWARQENPHKAEEIFLLMCKDVNRGNTAAKPQTSTYNSTYKHHKNIFSLLSCPIANINHYCFLLVSSAQGLGIFLASTSGPTC